MAKVDSERGTVELATEGLRLAELRFQEGVGTQSEVLDAELALTNAETSLIQALREYAVANASLEKAAGLSWFRDDLPAEKGDPEKPNVEDAAADLQE
jgi:outer membrane protein TolC